MVQIHSPRPFFQDLRPTAPRNLGTQSTKVGGPIFWSTDGGSIPIPSLFSIRYRQGALSANEQSEQKIDLMRIQC